MSLIYIFWTCSNLIEAKSIIHALLDKKLIACASFFPVESMFSWKEKIQHEQEIKVILKTQKKHFDGICAFIEKNASYETNEILSVSVDQGSKAYVNWLLKVLEPK